jgi:hypothetical protein
MVAATGYYPTMGSSDEETTVFNAESLSVPVLLFKVLHMFKNPFSTQKV